MEESKEFLSDNIDLAMIQNLSNLLGNGGIGNNILKALNGLDLQNTLNMANKVSNILNLFNKTQEKPNILANEENSLTSQKENDDRQINMLNAALPYVERSNQKNLMILMKFMEIRNIGVKNDIIMQSDEPMEDLQTRRGKLLNVIRPYLTEGEQNNIDFLMGFMELRNSNSKGES